MALDPNFALVHSGLAETYNLLGWYRMSRPADAFPKAKASALRALQLDDRLAEAYSSLGFTLMNHDWDWPAAERAFLKSLSLNPSYPTAHHWYAEFLMSRGRTRDGPNAFRRIALALEGVMEGAHMGHPDFRVNNRIFVTLQAPEGRRGPT